MKKMRRQIRSLWSALAAPGEELGRSPTCRLCRALTLLVISSLPFMLHAQEQVLWQIGKFDDSSQEFRGEAATHGGSGPDLVYTIGQSLEADWPRFQPGPANAIEGGRLHPLSILFTLPDVPRGLFRLRVAVLYETPRLSALRLEVNGHAGVFYFHPRLDFGAGDWEGTFVPQTSHDVKTIDIPTRWLKTGQNNLTLTAIDTPSTPQNSMGNIAPGQSGIVYDALALIRNSQDSYDPAFVAAHAVPTIFYKRSPAGLQETVDVCADLHAGVSPHADISLSLGGRRFAQPLAISGEFGEVCRHFSVPEWKGATRATISLEGRQFTDILHPARKWTLDIVPQEHLDIGFTDYAPKVAELQSESIDGVLDLLRQGHRFVWNLDGSWIARQYLAGRSAGRQEEFLAAVRSGRIIIPAQFANELTGTASLEGLIRSLYYSHALSAKYSLPIGAANITDVPSCSWSWASVLHDAGVKYLAAGSNAWRAPVLLLGRWNEKSPYYWEGPDGGKVMMWYSRAYLQLSSLYGNPPTLPAVEDATPVFLQAYTRPDYKADSVIIYGSQLENTPLSRAQIQLPAQWSEVYAYPRMVFTTFKAAMASIEAQFNGGLSHYRGDFGPYWEDGLTSDASHVSLFRQSRQRILTAEKMSAVPALLNPDLRPETSRLHHAWENLLLFNEHTWTAASATTQPEADQAREQLRQKDLESIDARNEIAKTVEQSWAQLESLITVHQDSILVFNSLSWTRSGWIETDLPDGEMIVDPLTHQPVPQTILRRESGTALPGFGAPPNRIRFEARDVPALGYRAFPVVASVSSRPSLPQTLRAGTVLENRYYRITLDPDHGAIRSIYDKQLDRELVDSGSPFLFGSYVYVEGGDNMPWNSLYRYGVAQQPAHLQPIEATHGKLVRLTESPAALQAVLESSAPNTPEIQLEITLPLNEKYIDLTWRLDKLATLHKEAAYFAFPFAASHPRFGYDTQNGWVNPARDELAGGSREWYAVNHWAEVSGEGVTAAIFPRDAPMATFGDIVRGAWPASFAPRSSTIFSWTMSNYWDTNYASSQGGKLTFRYRVVTMKEMDAHLLTRMAWEADTPLESDFVRADAGSRMLPATSASLLDIQSDAVVATTWKLAEDGHGSILRLLETAGRPEQVTIDSRYLRIRRAWRCNVLEQEQSPLPIQADRIHLTVPANGIATLRLETQPMRAAKGE